MSIIKSILKLLFWEPEENVQCHYCKKQIPRHRAWNLGNRIKNVGPICQPCIIKHHTKHGK